MEIALSWQKGVRVAGVHNDLRCLPLWLASKSGCTDAAANRTACGMGKVTRILKGVFFKLIFSPLLSKRVASCITFTCHALLTGAFFSCVGWSVARKTVGFLVTGFSADECLTRGNVFFGWDFFSVGSAGCTLMGFTVFGVPVSADGWGAVAQPVNIVANKAAITNERDSMFTRPAISLAFWKCGPRLPPHHL